VQFETKNSLSRQREHGQTIEVLLAFCSTSPEALKVDALITSEKLTTAIPRSMSRSNATISGEVASAT
jgi:hypothetical protein